MIAFRVPNESDSASTVSLKVLLPKNTVDRVGADHRDPRVDRVTKTRKLARPIENDDGEQVTSVVSQVAWRATGDGIVPGQYQDFDLSLGTLPDKGKMVFNAVQTYSDGTVVNWNEVSADKSVEPEHPAPTLTLTPAGRRPGGRLGPGHHQPHRRPGRPDHACDHHRRRRLGLGLAAAVGRCGPRRLTANRSAGLAARTLDARRGLR